VVLIEHGDLIEERRGGVDVLRIMVGHLARHEQSGAIHIRPAGSASSTEGWLLFRLGHPVMAFHDGQTTLQGLEALLAIEDDALSVDHQLRLYECTVAMLRPMMEQHPESILHLEHQSHGESEGAWWSSVRLPSTSWRRAARLEDIEAMDLDTEHQRRKSWPAQQRWLQPGGVYLIDSPDPHPMLQLGVELAERGVPLLGMFGLPQATTEAVARLPSPSCYALLSPHGGYEVLTQPESLTGTLESFQFGHDRTVVLIDGLDRLGNAWGDHLMLDTFRAMCDSVRLNDHVMVCTTDLEAFEHPVRQALLRESEPLSPSLLQSWVDQPEGLWDHPLLHAPDEDEEQWLEAQIRHQASLVTPSASVGSPSHLEGGSITVDDDTLASATLALNEVVDGWVNEPPSAPAESIETTSTRIGDTAWRPSMETPVEQGRFITESPRYQAPIDDIITPSQRRPRRPSKVIEERRPPVLRTPQRLPRRKPSPALPDIKPSAAFNRSSTVSTLPRTLPDWPQHATAANSFRKENMDRFEQRQSEAMQRQSAPPSTTPNPGLPDIVLASARVHPEANLPAPKANSTLTLPSMSSQTPLAGGHPPAPPKDQPSRESSTKEQRSPNMEALYNDWSATDERDGVDSTALYNERGEPLKRYKGGSS